MPKVFQNNSTAKQIIFNRFWELYSHYEKYFSYIDFCSKIKQLFIKEQPPAKKNTGGLEFWVVSELALYLLLRRFQYRSRIISEDIEPLGTEKAEVLNTEERLRDRLDIFKAEVRAADISARSGDINQPLRPAIAYRDAVAAVEKSQPLQ